MGTILCATRGGEASYRAQDAAIALAKEQGKQLIFVFVADIRFLERTARAVRPDVVEEEIARMGEFLLVMAQERAKEQGIHAAIRVRRGTIRGELVAAIRDEWADVLILGRPAGEESAFRLTALEEFAADIAEETGAEVRIV